MPAATQANLHNAGIECSEAAASSARHDVATEKPGSVPRAAVSVECSTVSSAESLPAPGLSSYTALTQLRPQPEAITVTQHRSNKEIRSCLQQLLRQPLWQPLWQHWPCWHAPWRCHGRINAVDGMVLVDSNAVAVATMGPVAASSVCQQSRQLYQPQMTLLRSLQPHFRTTLNNSR